MSLMKLPTLAISREEASEQLGVSLDTFERHVQPHLRTVRVGRRILVPVASLEAFLSVEIA
jgi:excisionase family DNA binding protein